MLYFSAVMVTSVEGSNSAIFDILFAIPNGIIIFSTLFMRFYTFERYYVENNVSSYNVKKSFWNILIGLSSIAGASILWFITELNCDKHKWMRYTFAHLVWHICMSYGYYNLMSFLIYINALLRGKNPSYKKGVIYKILPVIECEYQYGTYCIESGV